MLDAIPTIPKDAPKRGQMWKHFKGTAVTVQGVGVHTETGELIVMYTEHSDADITFCRPLHMWADGVSGTQRFVKVLG